MDSIFPEINIELQNQIDNIQDETSTKIGRSFLFNNATKKFEFANGKNIEVDEKEALKQWIRLILRAYKDKVNIYKGTDFNCNIEDLIGQKLNVFNEITLKQEITESLLRNSLILSVDDFIITQNKNILNVEFTVILKNDELIKVSEVI